MKTRTLLFLFTLALFTASIGLSSAAPLANFSTNTTNGTMPLTVQFTDNSTNVTSWQWDFGDNETSILQNPIHTYINASVYTVTLNVSDGSNYSIASSTITVNETNANESNESNPTAIIANYTSNVISGIAPLTVNFNDTSAGSPISWLWNFQDGFGSIQQNPIHVFTSAGTYAVSLNVSNGSSYDVYTSNITVNESTNLSANFTSNVTSGIAPLAVQFTDTSINATGWAWDFDDGNISMVQNPLHVFNITGTFTVRLNITDGANYSVFSSNIVVNSTVPVQNLPVNNVNLLSVTATQVGQLDNVSSTITGLQLSRSTTSVRGTVQGPMNNSITAVTNGITGGYYFAALGIGLLGAVIVLRSLGYL